MTCEHDRDTDKPPVGDDAMTQRLSKSRLLSGWQCQKRLWLEHHRSALAACKGDSTTRLQTGNRIGELARRQTPGVFLDDRYSLSAALEKTQQLLQNDDPVVIHEATFSAAGLLVRGDILERDEYGCRLYEVKSSTRVKDYHLVDCAIQSWVMEQAGYPPDAVAVRHIDNSFLYHTPDDYAGLLREVTVTRQVDALKQQVPDWLAQCQQTLTGQEPDIAPGEQCRKPFDCPCQKYCNRDRATGYPVTSLPHAKKLASQLLGEGIIDIRDIPEAQLTKPLLRRIRQAVVSGQPYRSPDLAAQVRGMAWPRYYIDFETINPAIPLWTGTRPYQQIPFQWSCHIEREDNEVQHAEFLDISGGAPMRAFTESLLDTLGETGAVVVYNAAFERRILRDMAKRFPEYAERIDAIVARMVDLLEIARKHYYHRDMHGSWSIKKVLPTVAPELDYGNLEGVHDGGEAQNAYLECLQATGEDRQRLADQLRQYCELDTYAMVRIVQEWSRLTETAELDDTLSLLQSQ